MQDRGQAGVVHGLQRQGRTFAEGAVEHDGLAGLAGHGAEQTTRLDELREPSVGRVHRIGNHAVAVPFVILAQVDEDDVTLFPAVHGGVDVQGPFLDHRVGVLVADLEIRRYRDIHLLRVGQIEVVHDVDVFLGGTDLQARVVGPFLADRADRVALVVVGRVDQRILGQLEQLVEDRVVGGVGVAVLEIGPAGSADQQSIAGENTVGQPEAVGIVRMAGGLDDVQADALDLDLVALADPHRHHVDLAALAHNGDAAGQVTQGCEAGHVVGMGMGVDRLDQLQVKVLEQLDISFDLLEYGIDDQGLAADAAGEEIGVGGRNGFEQLAENHGRTHSSSWSKHDDWTFPPVDTGCSQWPPVLGPGGFSSHASAAAFSASAACNDGAPQ